MAVSEQVLAGRHEACLWLICPRTAGHPASYRGIDRLPGPEVDLAVGDCVVVLGVLPPASMPWALPPQPAAVPDKHLMVARDAATPRRLIGRGPWSGRRGCRRRQARCRLGC